MVAWRNLDRRPYRVALRRGLLRPGIAFAEPPVHGRVTVLFIHGGGGAPADFAALADALRGRVNLASFLYDDLGHLAPSAELLREEMLQVGGPLVIVASSIGTLLPAYVGATELDGRLDRVLAVYVNPLIGGSRYADTDPLLELLASVKGLGWLYGLKRAIQRTFFPPVVQDLTPESEFQQIIFGPHGRAAFVAGTVILFTERPGNEPDVAEHRVPMFFQRSRGELIERLGTVWPLAETPYAGHAAPQTHPELVAPALMNMLARVGSRWSQPA